MITLERWQKFSKRDQAGHIAAEIKRAEVTNGTEARLRMLETALNLIDLSLADSKWESSQRQLLVLRNLIAEAYINSDSDITKISAVL